jgi:hypothetical protein
MVNHRTSESSRSAMTCLCSESGNFSAFKACTSAASVNLRAAIVSGLLSDRAYPEYEANAIASAMFLPLALQL